ncbi:LysR family transcriptional regulator [Vibrio lentus]|uniref:LysR family transcriptional regulator n=1 Tax=Vibrio lentus TaxID=136468 RepID=UPI000977763E|nr:LysR family transcriptional regulator [Vibrio lentus]OMO23058.1 LysR family transcriptional regulator [Vibrio lentus]PMG19110.1 LysR family transcriptional regulator [Vibrio lentus]PMH16484.1 LysR family transcriptional regulator [Vibrio lentus]PMI43766.1 LysR family transcriptional regulator [Vibrio lentus]PMI65385.1 LysR family transcriptional regulator [Vibrio lentus]
MKRFNLNLIYYFIAIYEEGNLTYAAERLNISQPSLSAHLKQLRDEYRDLLFVRKSYTLEPTPVANDLYPIFKQAYKLVSHSLPETHDFDPQECSYTFRIAAMSISSSAILPKILDKIQKEAPNCVIEVVNIKEDMVTDIREKKIDLVVDLTNAHPTLQSQEIWSDELCAVCSQNHAQIEGQLTLERYLSEKHVMLTHDNYRVHQLTEFHSPIFSERKVARKLNSIADFSDTIYNSDWIATFPKSIANAYFDKSKIKMLDLPFEYKTPSLSVYWHSNRNDDIVNLWLRELFTSEVLSLSSEI